MSLALSAGVTGLGSYQQMLNIAGDNLANVGTTAFKAKRITFSQLLSETIKTASQPTTTVGGTNPQQLGHGIGIASIIPIMTQGNITNTGNPLDLAIEGEGYFALNDGSQDLYTRAGAFAIDADSRLVDPATGYIVQRIGTTGETDGFQTPGNSDVCLPTEVSMPAKATVEVAVVGNLSSDASFETAQTNMLASNVTFTTSNGSPAGSSTKVSELDQYTASSWTDGAITYSGYDPDGDSLDSLATLPKVALTQSVDSTTTLDEILTKLNGSGGSTETSEVQTLTPDVVATAGTFTLTIGGETATINFDDNAGDIETKLEALSTVGTGEITVGGTMLDDGVGGLTFTFSDEAGDVGMIGFNLDGLTGPTTAGSTIVETTKGVAINGILGSFATASLVNGKIRITDAQSGYSKTDFGMAWSDSNLTMPAYFEVAIVGGEEVKNINITVYDSLGGKHVLSGAFVRTDTTGTWDMIMTSISGDINDVTFDNRRINGVEFYSNNGSFKGLNETIGDTAEFVITFAHDTSNPQTIVLSMGGIGQFDGLTQFAGSSTAVAREQDGYAAGSFSNLSVSNEGIVVGAFTNGIKKNIATLQLALFQNSSALETVGNGYYTTSGNSGEAISTQAMTGGAGSIFGGALEGSNVDEATEFVRMIQAQNYYQANARTIKIANEMLKELTNLIR